MDSGAGAAAPAHGRGMRAQLYMMLPLLAVAGGGGGGPQGLRISAQQWCANSMRLDILPSPMPASAASTIAARDAMLKRRGLAMIPDALSGVATCDPGAVSTLSTPLSSGNLRAEVGADGASVIFTAADPTKVLFTATFGFAEQTHTSISRGGMCTPGRVVGHDIGDPVNMTIDGAVQHCGKILSGCVGFSVGRYNSPTCFGGNVQTIQFKRAAPGAGTTTDNDTHWSTWTNAGMPPGYLVSTVNVTAGSDKGERFYGLGQGGWAQPSPTCMLSSATSFFVPRGKRKRASADSFGMFYRWTGEGGCPAGPQEVV